MKKIEDSTLVELAKTGDSDAFGALVSRHAEAVKGYCYYRCGDFEESRDLCQETFVLAYTKLHQLRDPSKFSAWTRTIASNTCSRWLRSRREVPVPDIEVEASAAESPAASVVRDALSALPDNERLAVVMHYVDGLTYGDIAEFLEVSEGAVRGRLYRGREMLKKELVTMAEEEFGKYKLDNRFTEQTVALTRSFTYMGFGWSPDGENILFRRWSENGCQLWISNTHGVDAQPISEIGWQDTCAWSPDSRRIVYAHFPPRHENKGYGSINVYEIDRGAARVVSTEFRYGGDRGWYNAIWNKDSKKVAALMKRFEGNNSLVDAYVFDLETNTRIALTPDHYYTGRMNPGDWSPDGKHFAMTSQVSEDSNFRIWMCGGDGSNLHPITSEHWFVESDPRYRPGHDEIAFCTGRGRGVPGTTSMWDDVWTIRPDGTDPRRITNPESTDRREFRNPEWTSDGKYLVCLTRRLDAGEHESRGIHIINTDTRELIRVLEDDIHSNEYLIGFRNKISICPNGKRIAFTVAQFKVDDRARKAPVYSERQDILYFYEILTRQLHEVQRTSPERDGTLLFHHDYSWVPIWSPDCKRLLCTKGKVRNMADWNKPVGEDGRVVEYYGTGCLWDVLQPESEEHLCFFEIGD